MAVNALSPFVAQIFTRVLMLGYAIVQYRLLGGGANNLGDYFLAGIVLMYTGTIADWGLSTLLTREAAREQEAGEAHTLFQQTLILRLLISLTLFVPVGIFVLVYTTWFGLSSAGAWVALILTLSLLPGAFSGSVTALLYARERMSLPAAIGVGTSVLNVALGVMMLLLGWGVIGLALAALLSTLVTASIFFRVLRRDFPGFDRRPPATNYLAQSPIALLKAGWPLMLNALLVGLFFRADQFIIKARMSAIDVERYAAAYSFLSFVLLITPAVTLALFPLMARHAETDRARLAYEYTFTLKVLLLLSVPLIALTVWFAPLLITIVTGAKPEYLPQSSVALQILILFLPLSFINGVTQYVLIALNLQRLITRAFVLTVVFNVTANLILVPLIGINGAALATVASELVLLGPFLYWTSREIGAVPLVEITWRPVAGAVVVAAMGWLLHSAQDLWSRGGPEFAAFIGVGLLLVAIYGGLMLVLKPFSQTELNGIKRALRRTS